MRWGQQGGHGIAPKPAGEGCRDPPELLSSSSAAKLQQPKLQELLLWVAQRFFLVLGRVLLLVSAAQTPGTHHTALAGPPPRAHLVLYGCHIALRPPVHLHRGLRGRRHLEERCRLLPPHRGEAVQELVKLLVGLQVTKGKLG